MAWNARSTRGLMIVDNPIETGTRLRRNCRSGDSAIRARRHSSRMGQDGARVVAREIKMTRYTAPATAGFLLTVTAVCLSSREPATLLLKQERNGAPATNLTAAEFATLGDPLFN